MEIRGGAYSQIYLSWSRIICWTRNSVFSIPLVKALSSPMRFDLGTVIPFITRSFFFPLLPFLCIPVWNVNWNDFNEVRPVSTSFHLGVSVFKPNIYNLFLLRVKYKSFVESAEKLDWPSHQSPSCFHSMKKKQYSSLIFIYS